MKIGEDYIVKDDCDYFGPKYQGSTVVIKKISGPNDECLEVETFDGVSVMCTKSMLLSRKEYHSTKINQEGLVEPQVDFDKYGNPPCHHPDKYMNYIGPSLSFMVCPDCKQEVK